MLLRTDPTKMGPSPQIVRAANAVPRPRDVQRPACG